MTEAFAEAEELGSKKRIHPSGQYVEVFPDPIYCEVKALERLYAEGKSRPCLNPKPEGPNPIMVAFGAAIALRSQF